MKKSDQLIPEEYAGLLSEVKERIRSAQYDALRAGQQPVKTRHR